MTQQLEQLWEQVRDYSHPDHPFLDPTYSPSSLMPACDFTLWIRDRLIDDDIAAVRGLLAYISIKSESWWSVADAFYSWRVPGFDSAKEAELRASMLLCYRMGFSKEMRHLRFDWPRVWSVILAQGAEAYTVLPPTTRLVLAEHRGIRRAERFNASLFYGDRCYGNNADWNGHFLETLGLRKPLAAWAASCEAALPRCSALALQAACDFYQHDFEVAPEEIQIGNDGVSAEVSIISVLEQHWNAAYARHRRVRDQERINAESQNLAKLTPAERAARREKYRKLQAKFDQIDRVPTPTPTPTTQPSPEPERSSAEWLEIARTKARAALDKDRAKGLSHTPISSFGP